MGKNNNGLVYCRLINATVLYLSTTVLYFLYSTFDILMQIAYSGKLTVIKFSGFKMDITNIDRI